LSYSTIGIKFPIATYEAIKNDLPEATAYRTLSCLAHDGFIEIYYIIDSFIATPKQKQWVGNIKTKISRKLSDIDFEGVELDSEATVRALSGKTYNLKSLSDAWRKVKSAKKESDFYGDSFLEEHGTPLKAVENKWTDNQVIKDDFADEVIRVPQLIPLTMGGKEHENLYRTLCIYAKRLYREKLFIYEYLEMAAHIYVRGMSLLPKEARKITYKAWEFISEQIELNPEDFKQKLSAPELKAVKVQSGKRLQKYNDMRRTENIELINEAIASGKHYKSDGITLNKSSLATATGLSRVTINSILP
jgi:hypothetical protein